MAKAETRRKILEAAEQLFSQNGYDGAPTKLIAKEAGITEMTLFNHFPNKELLYKTIVKERHKVIEITSVYPQLTYDDLENDLMLVAHKLIKNFFENKYILMMRLKEKQSFQDDDIFKIENAPFLGQLLPIFKRYAEKDSLNGEAERITLVFLSAILGLFYVCLLDDKPEADVREMIELYVTTFSKGAAA